MENKLYGNNFFLFYHQNFKLITDVPSTFGRYVFFRKFKLGSNGKFIIGVKVSLIKKKPASKV